MDSAYYNILLRRQIGTFPVPMIHTAVLVNLEAESTNQISYLEKPERYRGPHDDIILFAESVQLKGIYD